MDSGFNLGSDRSLDLTWDLRLDFDYIGFFYWFWDLISDWIFFYLFGIELRGGFVIGIGIVFGIKLRIALSIRFGYDFLLDFGLNLRLGLKLDLGWVLGWI